LLGYLKIMETDSSQREPPCLYEKWEFCSNFITHTWQSRPENWATQALYEGGRHCRKWTL